MDVNGEDLASILKVMVIFLAFAFQHSLLTSRTIKAFSARIIGERPVKGFYRLFYTFWSFLTALFAIYLLLQIPDRHLWKAPLGLSILMHGVQVLGLVIGVVAFKRFNALEFVGIRQALLYLKGYPIEGDLEGISMKGLITDGIYGIVRHPMYLGGILIFTFEPNLTRNFMTLSILADLYFIYGALREDRALQERFEEFKEYKQKVPFIVPSPGRLLYRGAGSDNN